MNKLFAYITFALEIGSVIESIYQLIEAKQPITKASLEMVVMPGIQALHGISAKINPPQQLVDDILQTAADGINKYVLKIA